MGLIVLLAATRANAGDLADGEADDTPPAQDTSDALEVVVEARRDVPVVSEETLDRERVLLTPGTFEDPVRLVQSLPGVALTPEYGPQAGDLAIRGAAPWETRYLLDGIELPYLYHFNGYSSVFPARLLDELRLLPSTFGAEHGDATGAVVSTTSTWERDDSPTASANANFVMAGAGATLPSGPAWTARASGRRSYLDAVRRDEEQYTVFPVFSDWFARLEHTPSAGARWWASSFGAADHYTRYAGEPTTLDAYDQSQNPAFAYGKSFAAAAAGHRHVLGRSRVEGTLSYTRATQTGTLATASEDNSLSRLQLREEWHALPRDDLGLVTGIDARHEAQRLSVATDRAWPELERESALLARGLTVDEELSRVVAGAFAEARWTLGDVRLVPGARVDADTATGQVVVDPRLNARWQIGADERLRLAVGQYAQFPDLAWLSPGAGSPWLPVAVSRQAALGFDYAFAGRLELELDVWGKLGEGLVEIDAGSAPEAVDGVAYGAEVQSRYRLRDTFFASAGLSLSHAERGGEVFDYDQPWALNLVASWNFRPTWNAGLRYRAGAGMPYTPVVDGTYDAASDSYSPVLGADNSARLPVFQKVDLHLQKDWRFRTWSLAVYGEAWFVPPGNNVMYVAYRYDYDEVGAVEGPVFVPLLGVRGAWGGDRPAGPGD